MDAVASSKEAGEKRVRKLKPVKNATRVKRRHKLPHSYICCLTSRKQCGSPCEPETSPKVPEVYKHLAARSIEIGGFTTWGGASSCRMEGAKQDVWVDMKGIG